MNDKKMPLLSVEFSLSSDFADLERITNILELVPTRTRKKQDWPQGSRDTGVACDLWEISTEQETSKSVDEECKKMINKLRGKEKLIRDLCEEYNMESHFEVVIHMVNSETPAIYLEKESIYFLSTINADIGFDIYTYEDEEDY
ncbi:DUF4279 domain-containing protein [Lacrimispora sp. JR3]|uniref:DUF4279 domain-containing protein n=1 Tax=Lacrimispora sinapis TaxID=3111456 RepID=UPI003748FCE1